MTVQVLLTDEQVWLAKSEAARRQSQNERIGVRGRNRAPETGAEAMRMHFLGCIGEVVVADYLGLRDHLFSDDRPVRDSSDLPYGIEVKTRKRHGYDLLIQLDADPDKVYVLVTNEGYTAHIVGWALGRDVMRPTWVRELVRGRPCYVVPQAALNTADSLPEWVDSVATSGDPGDPKAVAWAEMNPVIELLPHWRSVKYFEKCSFVGALLLVEDCSEGTLSVRRVEGGTVRQL